MHRRLALLLLVHSVLSARLREEKEPASMPVATMPVATMPVAAAMPVAASRTSRWWFHTLNSSYSDLGTAIINKHRSSTTGVYLYMDTVTTHGCPAAAALGKPCGRFVIGPRGSFSAATDAEISARIRPYRAIGGGLTITVAMDLDMSAVLDGSVDNGIAAAVATAARHNLTGLMLDYEPRHNYTQNHAERYAGFVANLSKAAHAVGLQVDMCVSDWSILAPEWYGLYARTGADRIMSMGATYSGKNISDDRGIVVAAQLAGITTAQLAVGMGSMSSTPHPSDPGYNWTVSEMQGWVGWLEAQRVQHIDLWRADLNTLSPHDGTAPWVYSILAGFLAGGDGGIAAPAEPLSDHRAQRQ